MYNNSVECWKSIIYTYANEYVNESVYNNKRRYWTIFHMRDYRHFFAYYHIKKKWVSFPISLTLVFSPFPLCRTPSVSLFLSVYFCLHFTDVIWALQFNTSKSILNKLVSNMVVDHEIFTAHYKHFVNLWSGGAWRCDAILFFYIYMSANSNFWYYQIFQNFARVVVVFNTMLITQLKSGRC